MTLLLDTHILLWWLAGGERLTKRSRDAISLAEAVFVSAASGWEIAIKTEMGKLEFDGDLEEQISINNFIALPVTLAHAAAAGKLPRHHEDPFERMLVAQATLESLTLLTADKQMAAYDAKVIVQ